MQLLVSFVLYLACMMTIGIWAFRKTEDLTDFMLGGRKLGPWVTALSAGASDMSGWLLMGLPGAVFLSGLSESWILLGLLLGALCNWHWVAPRLRKMSESLQALTFAEFLSNRFGDDKGHLKLLSALLTLAFFTIYCASGLVAGAKLFSSLFEISYATALILSTILILGYTLVGGFLAVSVTDFVQSLLMAFALVLCPCIAAVQLGGVSEAASRLQQLDPTLLSPFAKVEWIGLLSMLGWGLGYVGQPHILIRFMAADSVESLPKAKKIGMIWMGITLVAAVVIGLTGRALYLNEATVLAEPESIFIQMTQDLLTPWLAGIVLAAILAAVMSTIDSQLLVASSCISDLFCYFRGKSLQDSSMVLLNRAGIFAIALLAIVLAWNPENEVLSLVQSAWGGLGASFGPVLLFALFSKSNSILTAFLGVATGGLSYFFWESQAGGIFELYGLVPAFALSLGVLFICHRFLPQAD